MSTVLDNNSILGNRIREKRKEKGWTIQQLAKKVFMSPTGLGDIERNQAAPDLLNVARIADALDCSIDYLCGFIDKTNHDLQFICSETGLEEKTVKKLMKRAKSKELPDVNYRAHLNGLIQNTRIIENIIDYKGYLSRKNLGYQTIEYVKPNEDGELVYDPAQKINVHTPFKIDGIEIQMELFTEAVLRIIEDEIKKLKPIMPIP